MHSHFQICLLSLTIAGTVSAGCPIGPAAGSDKTAQVFAGSDLPVIVPQKLTQQEYYALASQYGWSHPSQALECISKIEKNNPGSPLAAAATRLKDTVLPKQIPPAEAIELALKAQNAWQDPAKTSTWYIGAQKYANECIAKYPNFEYGYMSLANLQALDNKRDLAAQSYRRALTINPRNAHAWDGLGDQLLDLHQATEAKSAFEKALFYDPEDTLAQNRLDNMQAYEQSSSPFAPISNFFSTAAAIVILPVALMVRDQEALKTSGFIDKTGKFAFHQLNSGPVRQFSNGLLLVWDHFVDKQGKTVGKNTFSAGEDFSEGFAAVCKKQGEWGYLDTSGEYAIAPQFQAAKSFHEGLAPAKSGARWGFVDKTGKWAVPPRFTGALPFSDGLAAVVLGGKIGYVDHQGKMIISAQFDAAFSFSDGLALVTTYETPILRHHERCIDKTGKVVFDLTALKQKIEKRQDFPQEYSGRIYNYSASPDFLVAEVSEFEGSPAFTLADHDDPQRFSEGLMLVHCGKEYGFVDKSGNLAIPCKFGSAAPFKEGLACVSLDAPSSNSNYSNKKNNQRFGYIDKTGKFAIQPRFDYASEFHEGQAFVRENMSTNTNTSTTTKSTSTTIANTTAGFIDHSGQIVLPVPSGTGRDFHDGLARVGEPVVYP